MSRITRKFQKIFALGAANNGQFGSGKTGAKVTSNDLDVIQNLAAWNTGWLDAIISAQDLPPLEEMQSTNYVNTSQLAYLFQEGISEWETATTYYQYSVVKKTNTFDLYGSLTNTNQGNALTDTTNWIFLGSLLKPITISMGLEAIAPVGKLLIEGGSIAKTSGGTYNGIDLERVYTYWWTNVSNPSSNTIAPVTGGLGASAAADFAANKKITMPNWANHSPYGVGTLIAGQSGGSPTPTPTGAISINPVTLTTGQLPALTYTADCAHPTDGGTTRMAAGDIAFGSPSTVVGRISTNAGGGSFTPTGSTTLNPLDVLHPVFAVHWYIDK